MICLTSDNKESTEKIESMIVRWTYEAWEDAFLHRAKQIARIYSYWVGYMNFGFRLQQDLGVDNADYYFSLEGQTDTQASTLLIISGYTRQANALLRGILENILLGLWFGFDRQSYEKWKNKDDDAPFKNRKFFRKAWVKELLTKRPFRKYNEECNLVEHVWKLYQELSIEVHALEIKSHVTTASGDSVVRFNPMLFDKWYENMVSIFEIMSIILFLRYPRLMSEMSQEVREILQLLPQDTIREIKQYI